MRWLQQQLDIDEVLQLAPVTGGLSNENFTLYGGGLSWFLKKAPTLTAHQSAHNVLREYTILKALQKTPVRVPRTIICCDDRSVIGAPFFIFEQVNGAILTEPMSRLHGMSYESYPVFARQLVDAMLELHQQNWQQLGLAGIGKADGFLERQVSRWLSQYRAIDSANRRLPHVEQLAVWLQTNIPPAQATVLVHGDYQLNNMLFAAQLPARLLALLDWELATLGDPLLDLATLIISWADRGEVAGQQLADHYAAASGIDISRLNYYQVLAAWKQAIIAESRYIIAHHAGVSDSKRRDYQWLETHIPALLEQALVWANR